MAPPSRVLITGAGGFVGSRVLDSWPSAFPWPKADLRDKAAVRAALDTLDVFGSVLHLAAISQPRVSLSDPIACYELNVMGTVHLLESLKEVGWKGRFLYVSSAAVYGDPDRVTMPLRETSPLQPTTPYAASKASGEHAVLEWGQRAGATVMVARPTNHTGPGQSDDYFLSSMARQITRVPRGEAVTVEVGNLSPYRDFMHVDDVVDAYHALLVRGRGGTVYNVARGQSQPLSALLQGLVEASGRQVDIQVSSERFREEASQPVDVPVERLKKDTGWRPARGLDRLYTDLIHFWETQE